MMKRKVKGFDIFANIVMIIIVLFCIIPLILLVMSSLTDKIMHCCAMVTRSGHLSLA